MDTQLTLGLEHLGQRLDDLLSARADEQAKLTQLYDDVQALAALARAAPAPRATRDEEGPRKRPRCGDGCSSAVPAPPPEAAQGPLGIWEPLTEPSVAVRAAGETLHIHGAVLQRIPFFAALLQGAWSDARCPDVALPCTAAEFSLLVRRLYTGEPLGKAAGPLDCAAALRLAAAAGMLLLEDQLPELPALVRGAVASPADAAAVREALPTLPSSVAEPLASIAPAPTAPSAAICEMVVKARWEEAQNAACGILGANRGHLDLEALAAAVEQVLQRGLRSHVFSQDIRWSLRVANQHLPLAIASRIFETAATFAFCEVHAADSWAALRGAFGEHLLRCAREGGAAAALALGTDESRQLRCTVYSHAQCINKVPPLCSLSGEQAAVVAEAARAAPKEHPAIAELLARLPPARLADLGSDELLPALGGEAAAVVGRLASEPAAARRWATPARLATLPLLQRRTLCSGLIKEFERLDAVVATCVMGTLT